MPLPTSPSSLPSQFKIAYSAAVSIFTGSIVFSLKHFHHLRNLFQDDEDETSYDEQPVNAHGVLQEEAPEEEFGSLEEGADEPLQEAEEASDSLVYETELVCTIFTHCYFQYPVKSSFDTASFLSLLVCKVASILLIMDVFSLYLHCRKSQTQYIILNKLYERKVFLHKIRIPT